MLRRWTERIAEKASFRAGKCRADEIFARAAELRGVEKLMLGPVAGAGTGKFVNCGRQAVVGVLPVRSHLHLKGHNDSADVRPCSVSPMSFGLLSLNWRYKRSPKKKKPVHLDGRAEPTPRHEMWCPRSNCLIGIWAVCEKVDVEIVYGRGKVHPAVWPVKVGTSQFRTDAGDREPPGRELGLHSLAWPLPGCS